MTYLRRRGMQTRSIAPRQVCPSCSKRGLGNVRIGRSWEPDVRECRYCDYRHIVRPASAKDNSR
jgi:hypothetical protein